MCDYGAIDGYNNRIYAEQEQKERKAERKERERRAKKPHAYQYFYYFAPQCTLCWKHESDRIHTGSASLTAK